MELYVGNLPWSMTNESLTALFTTHGAVTQSKIVMDRDTGRSRGFGFVSMANDAEGQKAIAALNGSQQEGRAMTVRVAEPRQASGGGGGGGGFGGGAPRGPGRDRR